MDSYDYHSRGDPPHHFEDKWPNMPMTHGRKLDAPFIITAIAVALLLAALVFYLT